MADLQTLARPYARAAFAHAQSDSIEQWSEALGRLAQALEDDTVCAVISTPQVRNEQLVELLVAVSGVESANVRNFLSLLAEYRRLPLLPQIAEQFADLRAAAEQRLDATVVAAMPVDDAQGAALQAALEKKLSRKVTLSFQEDPSLIGGVVIKSGDMVIDGSVSGELTLLANQLS